MAHSTCLMINNTNHVTTNESNSNSLVTKDDAVDRLTDIEQRQTIIDSPSTSSKHNNITSSNKSRRVTWSLPVTNSIVVKKLNNATQQWRIDQQELLRIIIVYIQSIRTPIWCLRILRNLQKSNNNGSLSSSSTSSSSLLFAKSLNNKEDDDDDDDFDGVTNTTISTNTNTNTNTNNYDTSIYIISGLDAVFLPPPNINIASPSFVEAPVRIIGYKVPEYIWYMFSSFCGDIIQFVLMVVIQNWLYITSFTTGWFIGSIASIPFRHTLHRYIVFGNYIGGYYKSLVRMYILFSIVSILSTIFHAAISSIFISFHYSILFIITINATGICNYFLLKQVWSEK